MKKLTSQGEVEANVSFRVPNFLGSFAEKLSLPGICQHCDRDEIVHLSIVSPVKFWTKFFLLVKFPIKQQTSPLRGVIYHPLFFKKKKSCSVFTEPFTPNRTVRTPNHRYHLKLQCYSTLTEREMGQ